MMAFYHPGLQRLLERAGARRRTPSLHCRLCSQSVRMICLSCAELSPFGWASLVGLRYHQRPSTSYPAHASISCRTHCSSYELFALAVMPIISCTEQIADGLQIALIRYRSENGDSYSTGFLLQESWVLPSG